MFKSNMKHLNFEIVVLKQFGTAWLVTLFSLSKITPVYIDYQ